MYIDKIQHLTTPTFNIIKLAEFVEENIVPEYSIPTATITKMFDIWDAEPTNDFRLAGDGKQKVVDILIDIAVLVHNDLQKLKTINKDVPTWNQEAQLREIHGKTPSEILSHGIHSIIRLSRVIDSVTVEKYQYNNLYYHKEMYNAMLELGKQASEESRRKVFARVILSGFQGIETANIRNLSKLDTLIPLAVEQAKEREIVTSLTTPNYDIFADLLVYGASLADVTIAESNIEDIADVLLEVFSSSNITIQDEVTDITKRIYNSYVANKPTRLAKAEIVMHFCALGRDESDAKELLTNKLKEVVQQTVIADSFMNLGQDLNDSRRLRTRVKGRLKSLAPKKFKIDAKSSLKRMVANTYKKYYKTKFYPYPKTETYKTNVFPNKRVEELKLNKRLNSILHRTLGLEEDYAHSYYGFENVIGIDELNDIVAGKDSFNDIINYITFIENELRLLEEKARTPEDAISNILVKLIRILTKEDAPYRQFVMVELDMSEHF